MSTTGGLAPSAAPLQFPEYIPWAGPAAPRVPGAQPGPGAQWARNGWRGWPAGRSHCAGEAPRCAHKPSPSRGVSASPGSGEVPGSWRATKRACRPVCGSSSWGSWQAQPPPSANGWERGGREGGRRQLAAGPGPARSLCLLGGWCWGWRLSLCPGPSPSPSVSISPPQTSPPLGLGPGSIPRW